jgi:hypothetical protein
VRVDVLGLFEELRNMRWDRIRVAGLGMFVLGIAGCGFLVMWSLTNPDNEEIGFFQLGVLRRLAEEPSFRDSPAGSAFRIELKEFIEANKPILWRDYKNLLKWAKTYEEDRNRQWKEEEKQRLLETLSPKSEVWSVEPSTMPSVLEMIKRRDEANQRVQDSMRELEESRKTFERVTMFPAVGISPEDGNLTVWLIEKPK